MPSWLVARITFLETLRRKDFYVLLILMGLYALVAVVLLQESPQENEAVRRTLFSLGLSFSFASAVILVVVLAARQVPKEIEQGTILPLLARPISRWQFLFGKFLACWLAGVISLLCFMILIRVLVPAPARFSELLFAQTIVLKAAGLAALAAMTLMFSLFMPETLNVTLSLAYYFLWGIVFNIIEAGLNLIGGVAAWVLAYFFWTLPHFEVLNISRLCMAQSAPLGWVPAILLLIYAGAYVTIALTVAHNLFEKRWV